MAANKQQGQSFGLFLVGITVFSAGFLGGAIGKVAMIAGIVLLALAFFQMFKIKPLEGAVANGAQPAAMKLLGCVVALAGWAVALIGLHLTTSTGGRMVAVLVGIGISLVSLFGILPAACNKNAIWKA